MTLPSKDAKHIKVSSILNATNAIAIRTVAVVRVRASETGFEVQVVSVVAIDHTVDRTAPVVAPGAFLPPFATIVAVVPSHNKL